MDLMPDNEIIGFYQDEDGMPPFKEKRMDWHDFPELVKRANMKPPTVPILPAPELLGSHRFDTMHNGLSKPREIPLFLAGR
jgi:hypothetical protein